MERRILTETELANALDRLAGWQAEGMSIKKRLEFPNFSKALHFVNEVGELADAADHHPDIKLGWGYAELVMMTHDRGGVTDVDIALAAKIDRLSA